MLVPNHIKTRNGIAAKTIALNCSTCNNIIKLDAVFLVCEDDWPEFRYLLLKRDLSEVSCEHCSHVYQIKSPLLYEVPKRNLLIFATNGGDDGGVIQGFEIWKSHAKNLLTEETFRRIEQHQYTFVHGLHGLNALLEAFDDESPFSMYVPAPPKTADGSQDKIGITHLTGYIYGNLFFYYPAHKPVSDLSLMLLELASINSSHSSIRWIFDLFETVLFTLGQGHPWLMQEAGRLAMLCGNLVKATEYTSMACKLQHSWIAPTACFLHGTPRIRADGPSQKAYLPHSAKTSLLNGVNQHRHTDIKISPSIKDVGVWDFPHTEDLALFKGYTKNTLLKSHGYTLGKMEMGIRGKDVHVTEQLIALYAHLIWRSMNMLNSYNDPECHKAFWTEYLDTRWNRYSQNLALLRQVLEFRICEASFQIAPAEEKSSKIDANKWQIHLWKKAIDFINA
ncbi:CpXC domain-containing protein [Dinghuibacter silviterrae]|uniref:CpXC motif protein n=1 Tax=Dinghuibacter silviterrae TaxID=1539049 RepID=A0A4R8DPF9_9BACT|nr:CpXC domain-containing protein [Dinghuibacter silviterrae]TDW99738.1 CpXC motif protein [Dinghuibacter silviterrae]